MDELKEKLDRIISILEGMNLTSEGTAQLINSIDDKVIVLEERVSNISKKADIIEEKVSSIEIDVSGISLSMD